MATNVLRARISGVLASIAGTVLAGGELAGLLAECEQALPRCPDGWRPMETAPHGERILTLMKHGVIEGMWDGETASGYYWRDMEWNPKGWMPLPPPPQ